MIQRSLAKKRSGEGGFTLIELLIVIVILGILAAIVVLAIGGLAQKSHQSACAATAKTIQTADDAYYASTGQNVTYAPDLNTLYTQGLLKSDPSADWSYVPANGGTTYTLKGTGGTSGACAGVDGPNGTNTGFTQAN
jgi:general secretion pathway protein G